MERQEGEQLVAVVICALPCAVLASKAKAEVPNTMGTRRGAGGQNLCRRPPSAQPRSPSAQQSSRRHSLAVGTEPPGPTAAVGTLWPSAQTLSVPTARSLAVGTWLYGGATDSHRQRRQQVANGVKWADGQAVGTASPPNFPSSRPYSRQFFAPLPM